jgi:hypothetical protein
MSSLASLDFFGCVIGLAICYNDRLADIYIRLTVIIEARI